MSRKFVCVLLICLLNPTTYIAGTLGASHLATQPGNNSTYRNGRNERGPKAKAQTESIEAISWTNLVECAVVDNVLRRNTTSDPQLDAGAVSMQSIDSGDGYLEFTATERSTNRYCGLLSAPDSPPDPSDLDFAIFLSAKNHKAFVYERGVVQAHKKYRPGLKFRIAVEGNAVNYYRNGVRFYTSSTAPDYPLVAGASLIDADSTVQDATIGGASSNVHVFIRPKRKELLPGETAHFKSTVIGTSDSRVVWDANGGTITNDGVYVAPSAGGSYQIEARSVADPSISGSVTVDVATTTDSADAITISNVTTTNVSTNSAEIRWSTNVPTDSEVDFGRTPNYGKVAGPNPTLTTTHVVTALALSPNTLYHYQVRSSDRSGRLAVSGDLTFISAAESGGSGAPALAIASVSVSSIGSTTATVLWSTNQPSDSQVDYGTTTSYGSNSGVLSSLVTSHVVTLQSLSPTTLYHCRVKSKAATGPTVTSQDVTFTTTAVPDTSAPVISAVTSSGITSTAAVISWRTNEASDTQVEYGTTASYGSSSSLNPAMGTSHSASVAGLSASRQYHYRVKSRDAAGNLAVSGDFSFSTVATADTTAPVISGVFSSGVSSSSATITWTTNEVSDTQIDFGTTTSYGTSTAINPAMITSHSGSLSGLAASRLYHYRVKSRDAAGNLATSGDFTFSTTAAPDTTPPVISAVAASGMTTSSASVSWTTNEASDTQIDYGTTTSYGSSTGLSSSMVTSHSGSLGGLSSGSLYHFRVKSRDAAGNLAVSGDFTFSTVSSTDTTAPVISSVSASGMTSSGASVSWTTNEASNTQVDYGTTSSYGSSSALSSSMVTSHGQSLSGLSSGTLYHYRVKSRDAAGNLATSGDFTFTTSAAADTTPPVISAVTASGISSSGSTVNWTTNEGSNTQVDYGTTTSYGSSTTLSSTMVTSHSSALSGLSAGTTYHYRVKSRDAAGNLATSSDFTFATSAGSSGSSGCTPFVIEGFGAATTGGCSGRTIFVTNLNDSGPGSFRDAIEQQTGARIIKFSVAGDIALMSDLYLAGDSSNSHGNVTIDGSDAPNGGICIRSGNGSAGSTFFVVASNVIVRYLRFRQGPPRTGQGAVNVIGNNGFVPSNVVFDHCSISWGQDGSLDVSNGARNVTVQWCILAENSASGDSLIRYNNPTSISFHHNLFANSASTRRPGIYDGDIDVVNNVLYTNFISSPIKFENLINVSPDTRARVNFVGNYFKAGSSEIIINTQQIYLYNTPGSAASSVYLSGNISPSRPTSTLSETALVANNGIPITTTRLPYPQVTTTDAATAYGQVLATAGATLPRRDAVDSRIVGYVSSGTGAVVWPGLGGNPSALGGWPDLRQ